LVPTPYTTTTPGGRKENLPFSRRMAADLPNEQHQWTYTTNFEKVCT